MKVLLKGCIGSPTYFMLGTLIISTYILLGLLIIQLILLIFNIIIPRIVFVILTGYWIIDTCLLILTLSIGTLIVKIQESDWYRRSHPQYETPPPQKEKVQYEYVSSDERLKEEWREKERSNELRNNNFAEVIAMVMKADGITSKTEGKPSENI